MGALREADGVKCKRSRRTALEDVWPLSQGAWPPSRYPPWRYFPQRAPPRGPEGGLWVLGPDEGSVHCKWAARSLQCGGGWGGRDDRHPCF